MCVYVYVWVCKCACVRLCLVFMFPWIYCYTTTPDSVLNENRVRLLNASEMHTANKIVFSCVDRILDRTPDENGHSGHIEREPCAFDPLTYSRVLLRNNGR